jgi:NAD+ synthase (glutamine-hydrolysing)
MQITLCQTNFTIADFDSNSKILLETVKHHFDSTHAEPQLFVFPEGSLTGYPLHDLVEFKKIFEIQKKYLSQLLKKLPTQAHVLLGAIVPNPTRPGRPYLNAALYIHNRKICTIAKTLLPTWDVFNEERWFEPGQFRQNIIKIKNKKVFVTICEDIWGWEDKKLSNIYRKNLLKNFKAKVDLIVNLSSSPYTRDKEEQRFIVISKTAKHFKAPVVYCNRWGAEDELIFDGHSLICQKNGQIEYRLKGFEEDVVRVHLSEKNIILLPNKTLKSLKPQKFKIEHAAKALVSGIQEYCRKNHFSKIHLGLSGGIDSALVTCLAVEALGKKNVQAFALPTEFNAKESLLLARELANNLNISLQEIDIQSLYLKIKQTVDSVFGLNHFSVTHENIQSRLRGLILMAYANAHNSLLLATCNKSELATGYGTLYGDMNGGLLPIGDLYKTQVFEMANWYHDTKGWIPKGIITRPPSAELRPNQKDQDSLPKYDVLDRSLMHLIEEGRVTNSKIDTFSAKKLFLTEFKRWQGAPILKISPRSFGRGRHWPLSHGFKL